MLASTFSKYAEFELAAVAGDATGAPSEGDKNGLRLHVLEDRYHFNDTPTSKDELAALLTARSGAEPSLTVSFGEKVSTQQLTETLIFLGAIPGLEIQLQQEAS